jgi:hypothetical protein
VKYQKYVEKFWQNLARFEEDKAYQEYIAELSKIIELWVQRDIRQAGNHPPD